MARAREGRSDVGKIQVEAATLDVRDGESAPPLTAYAFGSSGKLLGRAELKSGAGTVPVAQTGEPDEIRLLVGPALDKTDDGELLSDLIRIRAAERMLRPDELDAKVALPVDRALWLCWWRFCTVRGTLLKRVVSGGVPIDLPVCNAEVEIYEVDPIWILVPRIPDWILERLRDVILVPRPPVPPWPPENGFTPPIPLPDPSPFLGVASLPAVQEANVAVAAEALHVADKAGEGAPRVFRFSGEEQTVVGREEAAVALQSVVESPVFQKAAAVGVSALRDAMVANPALVRPLLCFLWPPAVTTQLVATVTTDDCGHFRATFYRGCSSDVPDLYFKAYRLIGWWRFPIYQPTPIACYTWWDYVCGSEVTLVTTSPFAQTCPPCPPVIAPHHWVLAMAVGNTSLASLRGTSSSLSWNNGNVGLTSWDAPWGGYLRFRFEFDNTLRPDLNVRYYRVSWRKAGSGNPFVAMSDTQLRHYGHWVASVFVIDPYVLGPQTVGGSTNLFEIPPALPPVGQWVIADAVVDTSSAGLGASFVPPAEAGVYEIKLDLFDGNGVQVNATALGISYRIPSTTNLNGTIPTDDAAALGLVFGGSLVYRLHIDNNPCSGSIGAAQLGGQTADPNCGVLTYSSTAATLSLPFTASHPNGFATYSFQTLRGLVQVLADSGPVGPPPGSHTLTPTVASLLGPCTTAGFAEDLYVAATATDGWSRQSQYDAHPNPRPFVLKP